MPCFSVTWTASSSSRSASPGWLCWRSRRRSGHGDSRPRWRSYTALDRSEPSVAPGIDVGMDRLDGSAAYADIESGCRDRQTRTCIAGDLSTVAALDGIVRETFGQPRLGIVAAVRAEDVGQPRHLLYLVAESRMAARRSAATAGSQRFAIRPAPAWTTTTARWWADDVVELAGDRRAAPRGGRPPPPRPRAAGCARPAQRPGPASPPAPGRPPTARRRAMNTPRPRR